MGEPERRPEEAPVPLGREALSPSKIATLACPYRYQKLYLEGHEGSSGPELALGTLIHTVAAAYLQQLRNTSSGNDPEALQQLAVAVWRHRPHVIGAEHEEAFRHFVSVLSRRTFDPESIAEVEARLAFDADWKVQHWNSPKVAYGGIVDVVLVAEGQLHLIDWTTAAISGVFGAKKDFQLRMYALLGHRMWGFPTVTIETVSLRTGVSQSLVLDADDLREAEARLEVHRARLQDLLDGGPGPWPAVPGIECGICALDCPLEATQGPVRLADVSSATEALGQLILLNKRAKDVKKLLRAYSTFHGGVELNGVAYGPVPTKKRSFPSQEVAALLVDYGFDPYEILTVDTRKLTKTCKRDAKLLVQIEGLATVKESETFKLYNVGLPEDEEED